MKLVDKLEVIKNYLVLKSWMNSLVYKALPVGTIRRRGSGDYKKMEGGKWERIKTRKPKEKQEESKPNGINRLSEKTDGYTKLLNKYKKAAQEDLKNREGKTIQEIQRMKHQFDNNEFGMFEHSFRTTLQKAVEDKTISRNFANTLINDLNKNKGSWGAGFKGTFDDIKAYQDAIDKLKERIGKSKKEMDKPEERQEIEKPMKNKIKQAEKMVLNLKEGDDIEIYSPVKYDDNKKEWVYGWQPAKFSGLVNATDKGREWRANVDLENGKSYSAIAPEAIRIKNK